MEGDKWWHILASWHPLVFVRSTKNTKEICEGPIHLSECMQTSRKPV